MNTQTVSRPESPTSGAGQALTPHDIAFFKQHGYVVKPRFLDPDLMRLAVDRAWRELPDFFDRDDPSTWRGDVTDCCETRSIADRRGRVKFRQCLRTEELLMQLLPRNPFIRAAMEQMLGPGMVRSDNRIRGVYPTFPCPDYRHNVAPHRDRHPFHVSIVGYLEHVAPGGGGFTVWPGSHELMYHAFTTRSMDDEQSDRIPSLLQRMAHRHRIELYGEAGDVIFWHQRLLHTAGTNRTSRIRYAALCDFSRCDIEQTQSLPPADDMWEGWNI